VHHKDGSYTNNTMRRKCYRPITESSPTVCTRQMRWSRVDYTTIRMFTAREQAALQTFPPTYRFPKRLFDAIVGIGNAIPPSVAATLIGPAP